MTKKIAWVTGASSGVGLATARELAAAGFRVVMSARDRTALIRASKDVGSGADVCVLDVADAKSVRSAVTEIEARHGPVDVLVANAGMNFGVRAWGEVSQDDFRALVDVNLNGVFFCADAVLSGMRKRGGGVVITIASWAGRYVSAAAGPGYTAAKHAAVSLTHSLNMAEFRNGIRACALCPGEIATPAMSRRKVPPSADALAKMMSAEDVARVVRFVAETPAHVCINEMVFSPTWNAAYGAR